MAEPPIIQSGKPHTVSLPEGSTVAAHKRPRKASGQLPAAPPPLALRLGDLPDAQDRSIAQARPAAAGLRASPAQKTPATVPPATASVGLDAGLMARIAELEQRNARVRSMLPNQPVAPEPGEPT